VIIFADVLTIWDTLADFIERQMLLIKGVCIHGFGTFTFSQRKVEIGHGGSKNILIQRPIFTMAESFVQTHSLAYPKQHASGQIPVVAVNYTVISNGSPYDRDTVELSVREILQSLSKALSLGKSVNLDFPKLGRLFFRDKRAHMKFFKEFIRSIDSSGNIEVSFRQSKKQTDAESSIMTDPKNTRLVQKQHKILPKIPENSEVSSTHSTNKNTDDTSTIISPPNEPSLKHKKSAERPATPYHSPRPATVIPLPVVQGSPTGSSEEDKDTTDNDVKNNTCSHDKCGMCYICHQREARNLPVSVVEERKKQELLQDKLLQKFQERKNELFAANEKSRVLNNRQVAKEIAEFNLEAGDKKKRQQNHYTRAYEYNPLNMFNLRSKTPCYTKKQLEYCQQLDQQVKRRREAMEQLLRQDKISEKQEQDELNKELSSLRKVFEAKMAHRKASYKQALDDQVHLKMSLARSPSPVSQPVFCVHDPTSMQMSIERERAHKLFKDQMAAVLEKKHATKVKSLQEKEEEAKILHNNLQELKSDLRESIEERAQARKELEESWKEAVKKKQFFKHSEKLEDNAASILLHDQCKRYFRCNQCQRKIDFMGKSNIIADSRYVSGSRLIA
jgi:nucleoid DNA-binding protein